MLWSQDEGWCNGVVTLHNSAVMIHTSTSTNSKLYKLDRTNLNVLNKRSFYILLYLPTAKKKSYFEPDLWSNWYI